MGKQHINAELVILWMLNIRVLLLLLLSVKIHAWRLEDDNFLKGKYVVSSFLKHGYL